MINNNAQKGLIDFYQTLPKGFYKVEAIIGRRIKFGKKQYLIKWKDFPIEQATWEPIKNLENIFWEVEKYDRDYPEEKIINISDDEISIINNSSSDLNNKNIINKKVKKKNLSLNNEFYLGKKQMRKNQFLSKNNFNRIELKEIKGIKKNKNKVFLVNVLCYDNVKKISFKTQLKLSIMKKLNQKLINDFINEIENKNLIIELI